MVETESEGTSRIFDTVVIIDWKTGKFRCSKRPKKLRPSEVPIQLKLKVTLPDTPTYKAEGEIVVSPIKMSEILLEAIHDSNDGKQ